MKNAALLVVVVGSFLGACYVSFPEADYSIGCVKGDGGRPVPAEEGSGSDLIPCDAGAD